MADNTYEQYMSKLIDILTPLYVQKLNVIYDKTYSENKIHKNLLKEFQANLKSISTKSNEEKVDDYEEFKSFSNVSFLDKLVLYLFTTMGHIQHPTPFEYIYQT